MTEYDNTIVDDLVSRCLRCHDMCLTVARTRCRNLDFPLRDIVRQLLEACADACRTAAATIDEHGGCTLKVAIECENVCESCANTIADIKGLEKCAESCFAAAKACRSFSLHVSFDPMAI